MANEDKKDFNAMLNDNEKHSILVKDYENALFTI